MYDNSNREPVTSIGNSWVVCKSTSHPGYIYYFNTATGESIWNLSPEEVEKAQRSAKQFENHTNHTSSSCPEPVGPPGQQPATPKCSSFPPRECTKIHSNQLINNKVSTHGASCGLCVNTTPTSTGTGHLPSLNITLTNSRPEVDTDTTIEGVKIENCDPSTSSGFNISDEDGNKISGSAQNENTIGHKRRKDMPDYNLQKKISNCDLRHVLRNKKQFSNTFREEMNDVDPAADDHLQMQTDIEDKMLDDNALPEAYDLSSIKSLAKSDSNQDRWFVVVDANILLYHIQFLNAFVRSDNECCLMVPTNVYLELENQANTLLRPRIDYANILLTKLIDSGYALIEEETSDQGQIIMNEENILNCCLKLMEKKYFVILISNDTEIVKYKTKTDIPIFTARGLKHFLSTNTESVTYQLSELSSSFASRQIRITIVNDKNNINTTNFNNKNLANANHKCQQYHESQQKYQKHTQDSSPKPSRTTVNAEIQTDLTLTQLEEIERIYKIARLESFMRDDNKQSGEKHKNKHKLRRGKLNQSIDKESGNINSHSVVSCYNMVGEKNINLLDVQPGSNNSEKDDTNSQTSCSTIRLLPLPITEIVSCKETCNITSNEPNNVELQSEEDKPEEISDKVPKDNIEDKNVMFEVTSEIMEDSLQVKSDEWVSRFVQILEEALSQVLRSNSSTYLPPPPWSMYEAVMCVQEEFTDDLDVADSSRKFLKILSETSDTKGKINPDLSPSKYMEMYSYGVYLIDSLQGIFNNCEDLQAAAESLAKLLSDIQNPLQADPNNLETFTDVCQEDPVIREIQTSNNKTDISQEWTTKVHFVPPEKRNTNPTDYNVTSEGEISEEHKQYRSTLVPMVTFIRTNIEEYLYSNLEPSKSEGELSDDIPRLCYDATDQDGSNSNEENCNVFINQQTASNSPTIVNANTSQENNRTLHKDNTTVEPKIIRNFVHCTEFENRLLNKSRWKDTLNEINDMEVENGFDYENELDYEDTVDHEDNNLVNDGEDGVEEDLYAGDMIKFDMDEFPEFQNNHSQSLMQNDEVETIKLDFKYIVKNIAEEINMMYGFVYKFCTNSYDKLRDVSPTSDDKASIREKAKQAHVYIDKLCTALDRALHRDQGGSIYIRELLKNTEFNNLSLDDKELQNYGKFMAVCLEKMNALKDTVSAVLTAVNE